MSLKIGPISLKDLQTHPWLTHWSPLNQAPHGVGQLMVSLCSCSFHRSVPEKSALG